MKRIRNSSKGIVIEGERILLIKNQTETDTWYTLPGGGQHTFENLHEALKREIKEETGLDVTIDRLFCVRDYIGINHEFKNSDGDLHQVEFMFLCTPLGGKIHTTEKDENQVAVEWVLIRDLTKINLYPRVLKGHLENYMRLKEMPKDLYLGDVN